MSRDPQQSSPRAPSTDATEGEGAPSQPGLDARALEAQQEVVELLLSSGSSQSSSIDLSTFAQHAIDAAARVTGAGWGLLVSDDSRGGSGRMLYALSGTSQGKATSPPRVADLFSRSADTRTTRLGDARDGTPSFPWMTEIPEALRVSCLAAPIRSREGSVVGALILAHGSRDMFTDRGQRLLEAIAAQVGNAIDNERLRDELERTSDAERAARTEVEALALLKDEFLSTLSHELRTPLNAILGWSQTLQAEPTGDALRDRATDAIVRNATAQARLIENLLDMNRIMTGKIHLDLQVLDTAAVIDAALDGLRPSAEAKSIGIRVTVEPPHLEISADRDRLQQVFWNLLANSIKFTPRGGSIQVTARQHASSVELSVADTGVGIEPDFMPHVFDRFRQADASTTRRHPGLGLGLAIVKRLVETHGGSINCVSAGANRGATFTLRLPLRPEQVLPMSSRHPNVVTPAPPVVRGKVLEGIRVLAVDDDEDAREVLKNALERSGARVVTASSVDSALEALMSFSPHIVVSDIGMPDKDGYDLIREVRSLSPDVGGETPAIAVTAFARPEDRRQALSAGFQSHMAKPVKMNELIAAIHSILGPMTPGFAEPGA